MADPPAPQPTGPCSAWATLEDLPEGCPCRVVESGGETPSNDKMTELLGTATVVLWRALAMPNYGPCPYVIHPRLKVNTWSRRRDSSPERLGLWRFGECGCGCGCNAVWLHGGVFDVTEVVIDGDTIDPSEYELHDGAFLVRVHKDWPPGGGPAADEKFRITYVKGFAVPAFIRDAVVELANELWLQRCEASGGVLPKSVKSLSTQGTNYGFDDETVQQVKEAGRNLPAVFIATSTVNPTGAVMGSVVYSPDYPYENRTIRQFS